MVPSPGGRREAMENSEAKAETSRGGWKMMENDVFLCIHMLIYWMTINQIGVDEYMYVSNILYEIYEFH